MSVGTDYYCVNREKKVAFYIGRTNYEDTTELNWFEELISYLNNEENINENIINYLWSKCMFPSYQGIFASYLIDRDFEIVSEEGIDFKDYIVFEY